MIDTFTLAGLTIIGVTFLLAGTVKGVLGLGLPTVSLALLAATIDLKTAMALLLIPSLVTNLWQALSGGYGIRLLKRLWPFLTTATLSIWLGAMTLTFGNPLYLLIVLGILLLVYALFALLGLEFKVPPRYEKRIGLLLGLVNGVFTGMTGSFVVPGVMYLQAIGLHRDMLVQGMGMLFALSTLGLGVVLQKSSLLTAELTLISAVAVVPAIVGMILGQRLRKKISASRFRKVFFVSILLLAVFIIAKAVTSLVTVYQHPFFIRSGLLTEPTIVQRPACMN